MGKPAVAVFGNQKGFPELCLKMEADVRFKTLVLTGTVRGTIRHLRKLQSSCILGTWGKITCSYE